MPTPIHTSRAARRRWQWAIVIAGAVFLQCVLNGSALIGQTVMLPLGVLAQGRNYLPPDPKAPPVEAAQSVAFSDSVLNYEFSRRFAVEEFRAGRVPMWDPYSYAGVPFTHFGKYSPFNCVYFAFPGPITLAWMHLLKCLVATAGAFAVFRKIVGARFWPAAVGAWCYPLTGYFVLWQSFPISFVVAWYPALLVAVASVVRRSTGLGVIALAAFTTLTVLAGHADVGAQAIVASGLFGVWCLIRRYRSHGRAATLWAAAALTTGWGAGLALSAPYLLPLLEYAKTGQRIALRTAGAEERPPGELLDLLPMLIADWDGSHRTGAAFFANGNQMEGPAGAYVGLLATLAMAPLAWASRRHRALNIFWGITALLGAAWAIGIPGLVDLLRLPGLNMVSHNRFVFVTGFALLALAVTGLNRVWNRWPKWQPWFAAPGVLLAIILLASLARMTSLPANFEDRLLRMPEPEAKLLRAELASIYQLAALVSAIGVVVWVAFALGRAGPRGTRWLAAGMLLELIVWAKGYNPQSDPRLYFPPIAVIERIKEAGNERAVAVLCLPANLTQTLGLRDVRGYDGIDPRPVLEVLDRTREPFDSSPPYARTQSYIPAIQISSEGRLRVPAALSMLNVRYLILPAKLDSATPPVWEAEGYTVYENPAALPRVFVPNKVEVLRDDSAVLEAVAAPEFNPAVVSYVAEPVNVSSHAEGVASVSEMKPTEVVVSVDMKESGIVVLADQWAKGWRAVVDGSDAPIVRVNHALRGVVVPGGTHTIVFRYHPPGLLTGLWLALFGGLGLAFWYIGLRLWPWRGLANVAAMRGPKGK